MMTVRIFQPLKSAMQSGKGRLKGWTLSFEPLDPALPEPLMGWTSSRDMRHELVLSFQHCLRQLNMRGPEGFTTLFTHLPRSHFTLKTMALILRVHG